MNRLVRPVMIVLFFFGVLCLSASAQRGPGVGGPPPSGGHGPGAPGGMGSPGGLPPISPNNGSNAPGGTSGTAGTPRNGLQLGPVGRWWDDKSVVRTIGLRQDQQKKMDAIFDANKPAILDNYRTLQAEQSKLQALTKDPQVDKTKMFAEIDAVNQARASLQKVTTQTLLQIRQLMDADQITRLQKIQ